MKSCNIISPVLILVLLLVVSGCQNNEPPKNGVESTNNSNVLLFQAYLTPSDLYLLQPKQEPEFLGGGQVLGGIPWSPDRTKFLFNDSPSYRETELPPYLSMLDLVTMQITQINLLDRPLRVYWSPDGNYLLYGIGTIPEPPARFFTYDFRTGDNSLLTEIYQESEIIFEFGGWSADSQKFAFITKLNGQIDIYTIDITNSQIQQLTDTPEIEIWAVWSPVKNELLYGEILTSDEVYPAMMHTLHADALNLITESGEPVPFPTIESDRIFRPDWSADGKRLAFSVDGRLCILEIETELICPMEAIPAAANLVVGPPVWSADGAWLAFRAQERNELSCNKLYVFEVRTKEMTLVEEGTCNSSPMHWLASSFYYVTIEK